MRSLQHISATQKAYSTPWVQSFTLTRHPKCNLINLPLSIAKMATPPTTAPAPVSPKPAAAAPVGGAPPLSSTPPPSSNETPTGENQQAEEVQPESGPHSNLKSRKGGKSGKFRNRRPKRVREKVKFQKQNKALKLARKMGSAKSAKAGPTCSGWGRFGVALLWLLVLFLGGVTFSDQCCFCPTSATGTTLAESSPRPLSAAGCASESCTETPPRFYVEFNWETDTQCPAESKVGDVDSDLTVIVVEYTAPGLEGVVTNTTPTPKPTPTDIDSDGSRARAVREMFNRLSELVEGLVETFDEAFKPIRERAFEAASEGAERFGNYVWGHAGGVSDSLFVAFCGWVSVELNWKRERKREKSGGGEMNFEK